MNGDTKGDAVRDLDRSLTVLALQLRTLARIAHTLGHAQDVRHLEASAEMLVGIDMERSLAEYRKAVEWTLEQVAIELKGLGGNEWTEQPDRDQG